MVNSPPKPIGESFFLTEPSLELPSNRSAEELPKRRKLQKVPIEEFLKKVQQEQLQKTIRLMEQIEKKQYSASQRHQKQTAEISLKARKQNDLTQQLMEKKLEI
jgi:hypothetical protein